MRFVSYAVVESSGVSESPSVSVDSCYTGDNRCNRMEMAAAVRKKQNIQANSFSNDRHTNLRKMAFALCATGPVATASIHFGWQAIATECVLN